LADQTTLGANSAARVGCALLGIFLVSSGIGALALLPGELSEFDAETKSYVAVENFATVIFAALATTLLFRVVPGALLIAYRGRIADRLFSVGARQPSINARHLYAVGCMLLSFYVVIYAVPGIIAGVGWLLIVGHPDSTQYTWTAYLSRFLSSLAQLVLGVILYIHARRHRARQLTQAA